MAIEAPEGTFTEMGLDLDGEGNIIDPVRVPWSTGGMFTTPPGVLHPQAVPWKRAAFCHACRHLFTQWPWARVLYCLFSMQTHQGPQCWAVVDNLACPVCANYWLASGHMHACMRRLVALARERVR